MMKKTIKIPRVYTNPPCIDRLSYHTFNQKSLRQIDTRPKKCYKCDSNPVIIINKKYYCAKHGLEEVQTMEKSITETRTRTPEENIWIAIIQQCMEDAFGLSTSTNITPGEIKVAQDWFDSKRCSEVCEMAGTTRDHVQKLFRDLQRQYDSGNIDKDKLRTGIRNLDKML